MVMALPCPIQCPANCEKSGGLDGDGVDAGEEAGGCVGAGVLLHPVAKAEIARAAVSALSFGYVWWCAARTGATLFPLE
jgi:hypothetical protein